MDKKPLLETDYARYKRLRDERICNGYLKYSQEILNGEVSPNRVITVIAEENNLSRQTVYFVLKRLGIYKNGNHPVVSRTAVCQSSPSM